MAAGSPAISSTRTEVRRPRSGGPVGATGVAWLPGLLATWLWLALASGVPAANPGDEVVVVYNKRLPESKAVAEHYAQRRQVPAAQVLAIDTPPHELMSRKQFQNDIQHPLARALDKKGLWTIAPVTVPATNGTPPRTLRRVTSSKFRYLVLCYGIPIKILADTNIVEKGMEQLRPEMLRNEASVDSELTWLPWHQEEVRLYGPIPNLLYATTNAALFHPTNGYLMVNRLDGPSPEIAKGLVDQALEAERDGLWGRAYFDLRGITNGGYALGDEWLGAAANAARMAGFETYVDRQAATIPAEFPMSHIAIYAGWYAGSPTGPFALNKVEFMPGAIAYHLHSANAASIRSAKTCWAPALLARGAAVTLGSVHEPYLSGTPDIGVFLSRLIYGRFTVGEAAAAAQSMISWMTIVVGDPLYRPFRLDLRDRYQELEQRQSQLKDWAFLQILNLNVARGNRTLNDAAEALADSAETKQNAVLSEKLGDLFSALGKPSSAVHYWQQALKLEPSLHQRIRLTLALAPALTKLGEDDNAFALYREFLDELPDYAGRLAVLRAAQPLAAKLLKPQAETWQAEIDRLSPPPPPKDGASNAPAGGKGAAKKK